MNLFRQVVHKCCYPSCVGQPAKSWIWSPFGYNILLSLLRGGTVNTDDYVKVMLSATAGNYCLSLLKDIHCWTKAFPKNFHYDRSCIAHIQWLPAAFTRWSVHQLNSFISKKETWLTKNKLFYSPSCNKQELLQNVTNVSLETETLDFKSSAAKESISKWANQYENFNEFEIGSNFTSDTNFALVNVTTFQDQWKTSESSGFSVKVINSFNYTLDVKYETRFLEFPLQDEDLKLVILVPNEMDHLCTLFRRLSNEGMSVALASVQPLFTVNSKLDAPDIAISSETEIQFGDDNKPAFNGLSVQYGTVKIDDTGVFVKVLTCLSPSNSPNTQCVKESLKEDKLYFFAIIFKDTPLVTGQYLLFLPNSTSFL